MFTGVHFLLTMSCNFECDHCFLFCSPHFEGTFTVNQLRAVHDEMSKIDTIEMVYYEGGEPFLYYPLLLEGIKMSHERGFKTGVVTNSYWALSVEDAKLWLKPLLELGISDVSVSNDVFHHGEEKENPATKALVALKGLGISGGDICIEAPSIDIEKTQERGEPVIGGGAMFRGRAVEKLITDDLPRKHWEEFTECPHEELEKPGRVHADPFGNIHLCQGLSMGNMWKTPLSELVKNYKADSHPICGPIVKGGPALLAKQYQVDHEDYFVDECHFCYTVRKALVDKFPEYLAPKQVYGLNQ
ncbi:MAG: 4Fe-4S cluster-binding domain-containing protein [Candidatus Heimdallarchaeota archaeon]|nr:MAG: 4Fe-4S cluster-binding domain-containing protein [Candidatus Heimdallarchaeota archaeon]